MINITIGIDGKPSLTEINIGNKYENLDETIAFKLPEEYLEYNKYLIAYIKNKKTKEEITKVFPITNDQFTISTGLTSISGNWSIYVMCKQMPVDLTGDIIDLRGEDGEHITISDAITATVNDSYLDSDTFQNLPMDQNIKVIYDDLVQYKLDLEKAEATRTTAEMERKEAEKGRVAAETSRVEFEAARVTAENDRATAEESRATAEADRISKEAERQAEETKRQTAETNRIAEETKRVAAETKRQSDSATAIGNLNNLTTTVTNKLNNGDFIPNITAEAEIGISPTVTVTGEKDSPHFKFEIPEFGGIEEYDKTVENRIYQLGLDYYKESEGVDYSGYSYDKGADLLNIDGDYEQVTTQGYQLFNASRLPTATRAGVTVTNNDDGSFTISGSGNLSEGFAYSYTHTHAETLGMLKVGKITLNPNGDTYPRIVVQLLKSDGNPFFQLTATNRSVNITPEMLQDSGCRLQMIISGLSGQAIKSGTIKPMVWQEKNLFDYTAIPYKAVGNTTGGDSVTLFNNQDGSFTIAGKNLFNVNGNVNIRGYDGAQVNRNTVQDDILISEVNSNTSHGVGQRLYGLKGKTISFSAKLKSIGSGTGAILYIYDGGTLKKQAGLTTLNTVFVINNYTCETDDVVVAFATAGGTGAQFYDIMVNYGTAAAGYVSFDTPVTLNEVFANGMITWDNSTLKRRLRAGDITLETLSASSPYFEASLVQDNYILCRLFNSVDATVSKTINQEWIDVDNTIFRFLFYNASNQPSTPTVVYPIVYQPYDGTWEPFTDGELSPSPSYAQEPKFVGDIGQNLFDASKLPTTTKGGATVTNNNDGSFTISGSGALSENFSIAYSATNMVNYLKQGNIILDCVNTSYPYVEIQLKKEDNSNLIVLTNRSNAENSANITQEILSQISKIRVYIYGVIDGVIKGSVIKPMLYQVGDGQYRPFSENPKYYLDFVTSGKNLFDYTKSTEKCYLNNDGTLMTTESYKVSDFIPVIGGKTYYISKRGTIRSKFYNSSKEVLYDSWATSTDAATTMIIPNGASYFRFSYCINGDYKVDETTLQLELGSVATSYEPYKGLETTTLTFNEPLRALPNGISDYITQDGNVIRNVGEITYDGSSDESWNLNGLYGEKYIRFSASAPNVVAIQYKLGNVICDKFPYRPYDDANVSPDSEYIIAGSGYIYVLIEKSRLSDSTIQGFKTWLQSNHITVWYELATPTTELVDLPILPTYHPYTNIWQSQELQAKIRLGIRNLANYKSNKKYYSKEEVDSIVQELKNAIIALGGTFNV